MKFEIVTKNHESFEQLINKPTLVPFDNTIIKFFDKLSSALLSNNSYKKYPDLIAMAFWMRKSQLQRLKDSFISIKEENTYQLARGIVFHIAPSNVDTIFMYSWLLSLLMGNNNIIRISGKDSKQILILLELIGNLMMDQEFFLVADRNFIVKYDHDRKINEFFSELCHMRVIWGGDNTIHEIQKAQLPPTSKELTFADKFSISIIDAAAYLKIDKYNYFFDNFFNDAFVFEQMACSSPRLIVWLGNSDVIKDAKKHFWSYLIKKVNEKNVEIQDADIVNKLVVQHLIASNGNVGLPATKTNLVNRIELKELNKSYLGLHCGAGLFYEFSSDSLHKLLPIIDKKIQTVSSFGISKEQWHEFFNKYQPIGIDRVIPIGKALEFSKIWDGFNLLNEFSRTITIDIK